MPTILNFYSFIYYITFGITTSMQRTYIRGFTYHCAAYLSMGVSPMAMQGQPLRGWSFTKLTINNELYIKHNVK